jgi:hypothetical protein
VSGGRASLRRCRSESSSYWVWRWRGADRGGEGGRDEQRCGVSRGVAGRRMGCVRVPIERMGTIVSCDGGCAGEGGRFIGGDDDLMRGERLVLRRR